MDQNTPETEVSAGLFSVFHAHYSLDISLVNLVMLYSIWNKQQAELYFTSSAFSFIPSHVVTLTSDHLVISA